MIEISLGKLVLLALIALIVLGPEKLPAAARTAGALLRRVRSGWDNVRSEVERELEIEEIKRHAREAAARAEAAQKAAEEAVRQTAADVREPLEEAADAVRDSARSVRDAAAAGTTAATTKQHIGAGEATDATDAPDAPVTDSRKESPHGHA